MSHGSRYICSVCGNLYFTSRIQKVPPCQVKYLRPLSRSHNLHSTFHAPAYCLAMSLYLKMLKHKKEGKHQLILTSPSSSSSSSYSSYSYYCTTSLLAQIGFQLSHQKPPKVYFHQIFNLHNRRDFQHAPNNHNSSKSAFVLSGYLKYMFRFHFEFVF